MDNPWNTKASSSRPRNSPFSWGILGNVINKKINSEAEILPCPSMTEFSTSSIPSTSQQDLDGFGGKETPSASSITPSFVPETPRQRETSRGKKNADSNVSTLINIAEKIQTTVQSSKNTMNSSEAFETFVGITLMEMPAEVRQNKMKAICDVLFE
nr:PREDICTED: uncharacterized protein LOC107399119 [Tribolium castaneum]|eukprot:XP_015840303.1 PREDICTED: uncharacterized protein LOC107399119 [Tribolium castaneum]